MSALDEPEILGTAEPVPVRGDVFPLAKFVSQNSQVHGAFLDQSAIADAGATIRQMREVAQLTRAQLAHSLNVSEPYLNEMERGDGTKGPTFALLTRIAGICNVTLRV